MPIAREVLPDAAVPARHRPLSARATVLAALLALVLLGLAWELWLAPTGRGTLAIKVLPLAACVAGVWRSRLATFRVLSLLVWLYVAEGLVRATTEGGAARVLALAELLLCAVIFTASVIHIRSGATRRQADEP